MSDWLLIDLKRTILLCGALLVFPLFVQETPAPRGLWEVSALHIQPLNWSLADRYYTRSLAAYEQGNIPLSKEYLVAAIVFDPQPMSARFKVFQAARAKFVRP